MNRNPQQVKPFADTGCGHGASAIVMANAFPNSRLVGFEHHPDPIITARGRATAAGCSDNINPVSRLCYAAATAACTPRSKSQAAGLALGARAGPEKMTALLHEAGFSTARLAAQPPFYSIIEAKGVNR